MRGLWAVPAVLVSLVLGAAQLHPAREPDSDHPERRGLGLARPEAMSPRADSVGPPRRIPFDIDRSLFVRHPARLGAISFEAVMERLAASAGIAGGQQLLAQWFGLMGTGTDEEVAAGRACPAEGSGAVVPTLNRFPMLCDDRLAAIGSSAASFGTDEEPGFIIVGAVNRVDLSGTGDCGEYRLLAASTARLEPDKVFVIFEAVVRDPDGDGALCLAIQEMWAGFSSAERGDDQAVAESLRRFFLEGGVLSSDGLWVGQGGEEEGFALAPVIGMENLGGTPGDPRGQLRTNTLTSQRWVLREFAFRAEDGGGGRLVATPTTGSVEPGLFERGAPGSDDLARLLEASTDLTDPNILRFRMLPAPDHYASQLELPESSPHKFAYSEYLRPGDWEPADAIRRAISDLAAIPDPPFQNFNIVRRLEILSCAGCHEHVSSAAARFEDDLGRPMRWPGSLNFTHVQPRLAPDGGYAISATLTCLLLPHRARVMLGMLDAEAVPALPDPQASTTCGSFYDVR